MYINSLWRTLNNKLVPLMSASKKGTTGHDPRYPPTNVSRPTSLRPRPCGNQHPLVIKLQRIRLANEGVNKRPKSRKEIINIRNIRPHGPAILPKSAFWVSLLNTKTAFSTNHTPKFIQFVGVPGWGRFLIRFA